MGTPDYIAPEQATSSHSVDIRADLYSLGCTLYFLLTGRAPFHGGSLAQKLLWHQSAEPEPIEKLRKDVPAELTALVRKLMAKRPVDRYRAPGELSTALAAFCAGNIPVAVPVSAGGSAAFAPTEAPVASLASPGTETVPTALLVGPGDATAAATTSAPPLFGRRVGRLGAAVAGVLLLVLLVILLRGRTGKSDRKDAGSGWPLDNLEPSAFDEVRAFDWPPKGLVLVLGSHRGRHWGPVRAVARSPDGKLIASAGDDNLICVWKADTLEEYRLLRGHTKAVLAVAFSPDSKRLLSGGADKTVRLWDVEAREELLTLSGHTDPLSCVAFAHDGRYAISGGEGAIDHTVRVWDLSGNKKELYRFKEHTGKILTVVFSPDGSRAYSSSADGTVRFWDLKEGGELKGLQRKFPEPVLALSADGRHGYSGTFGGTRGWIWDLESGKAAGVLQTHTTLNVGLTISPDGNRIAGGGGTLNSGEGYWLAVCDAKAGKVLRDFRDAMQVNTSLAFSPRGERVVSGSDNGLVQIWDIESGNELIPRPGHRFAVRGVVLSGDGRFVLTGGDDKKARLWDLTSDPPGKEAKRFEGHTGMVTSVSLTPDGTRAASGGSSDRSARVWDVASGKELQQFVTPINCNTLALTPALLRFSGGLGWACAVV